MIDKFNYIKICKIEYQKNSQKESEKYEPYLGKIFLR